MKKNKFLVFYTILASAVIAFAIGFLAYNLVNEYNHGYERTKRRFDHLTNNVKKIHEKDYETRRAYDLELEKVIGELSDFSFLEITEDGKTIYIYPDENAKSDSSSKLIKHYYGYFDLTSSSIYITADLYVLRPASIYYYSKISFLIVLITTVITLILVIYFNIHDPNKTSSSIELELDEEEENTDEIEDVSAEFEDEIKDDSSLQDTIIDNDNKTVIPAEDSGSVFDEALRSIEASEKNEDSTEDIEDEIIDSEIEELNETETEEPLDLPYKEFEPAEIKTLPEEENDPSGLFSPVTGLGWENYLMTRLDNELNRAIGSEFDLALFIFKIPGLKRENEKIKQVCEYLVSMFQFKDLLFEYKNDSIVAIKVNMPLENALSWADKLYVDIKNIIGGSNNCYIGITTRTIRMVSSERLLKEADEALIHAQEDPENPIIAFRANAEKYRQFLENK